MPVAHRFLVLGWGLLSLMFRGVQGETLLEEFGWTSVDCPYGHDRCGTLIFCDPEGSTYSYGYRQDGGVCSSPGPLLRLQAGLRYHLRLVNDVEGTATNLHTHGLHIGGSGNGDDVTRTVEYGSCLDYSWDMKGDHFGGTYWYHAHHHGETEAHVAGGAFGMVVVEDDPEAIGASEGAAAFLANEKALVAAKVGGQWVGNGVSGGAQFEVEDSVWYRVRLVTADPAGADMVYGVQQGGAECEARVVAYDGVLTTSVPGEAESSFPATGASRVDLAVRCSGALGAEGFVTADGTTVAVLTIVAQQVRDPQPTPFGTDGGAWTPTRPLYLQSLLDAEVGGTFTVALTRTTINGLSYNPNVPLATIEYGVVHEWTIQGSGAHPFHLHLYHFQVVTPGGCGDYKEGEFYDVISGGNPTCTIRFRAIDVAERCVLHCHILSHEDAGVMGWVDVRSSDDSHPVQSSSDPPRDAYTCASTVSPPSAAPLSIAPTTGSPSTSPVPAPPRTDAPETPIPATLAPASPAPVTPAPVSTPTPPVCLPVGALCLARTDCCSQRCRLNRPIPVCGGGRR